MKKQKLTRREFIAATGLTLTTLSGCSIVPRHTVARSGMIPPSERLNIACIGVGGQGGGDIDNIAAIGGSNIVALCDVDEVRAAETFKKFPQARRFKDFRKMLDAMDKDIDAVIVATPDHTHAVAAIAAMERGKHVYCEKPLAHSVYEVRRMMQAAKEHNVVTQLGNGGHGFESIRLFCEWIWDGAIGNVHTIHCGADAQNSGVDQLAALRQHHPVPATLDWDLWQGPARKRPYHPAFLPYTWRGWVPYGNGTIGDWICHVVDPVFWALDLGAPATIQSQVKDYNFKTQGLAYPKGEIVTFEFPANSKRGPITLHWYSGTERIPRPAELEPGRRDITTGAVVIGDKGTITYGSHGAMGVRLIPEKKMQEYKRPAKTLPRVEGHLQEWLGAIRTGRKASTDFSYAGPLTEIALLGVIATKLAGTKLEWDSKTMRFTNCDEANQYLKQAYRWGWGL